MEQKGVKVMLSKVQEQSWHRVRLVLAISWLILIFSLFYDPISHNLTDPDHLFSLFRDPILTRDPCVQVQGVCLDEKPYALGARLFWGMIVPSAIMIVLVFGHETWRRICPLYFLSQIPRALGLQPQRDISKNPWLVRNHLYVQFAIFFIGLNCRILFVNSERLVLGLFLSLTILSAMMMVLLYGGRSWCHYVCPFGMVQMVFTGPRGLLGTEAHNAPPKTITQSMCRTLDKTTGIEKSACISCKSPCMDIDSEKAYWQQLTKPGRKLVQYGYLGLVIGYFVYYWLYAGNFDYYLSGAWTHEENQLGALFKPGFYIMNQAIAIPKLVATPLTFVVFVALSCVICTKLEKRYKAALWRKNKSITHEQVLHRVFSICTFIAFNFFFIYGGRPEINRFPVLVQLMFQSVVILVSSLWLYQTWGRSSHQYTQESLADKLRRQLKKLPLDFSEFLEGRSVDELKPEELHILAKTLPGANQQYRLGVYKGVLREAIQSGHVNSASSLEVLQQIRDELGIKDQQHYQILEELGKEQENLPILYPHYGRDPYQVLSTIKERQKTSTCNQRTILRESRQQNRSDQRTKLLKDRQNENQPGDHD
ncbi:4Fe-4S binding protein [Moorena producens]|uniref:4Fe-4S binding protein n=1 Tax=Moorena producens TaxID=1155739 RepID=UPI003C76807A